MTDNTRGDTRGDTHRDTRAEQAFRAAFAREADHLEAPPRPVVRRRRRWPVLAAAAAVLVLVGGAGWVATHDQDAGPAPAVDEVAPFDGLPAADPGWRWFVHRDLAVQVPKTWDWGLSPACPDEAGGRSPYVAQDETGRVFDLLPCTTHDPDAPDGFDGAGPAARTPHVTFVDLDAFTSEEIADGTVTDRGWTLTARTLGSVQVRVLADGATSDQATRIVDTVRRTDVDQIGCPSRSVADRRGFQRPPAPTDLTRVEGVSSVAVCHYRRGDAPGLIGSRLLVGPEAAELVAAIVAAPTGGGPDRDTCSDDDLGETAILLRITADSTGTHDAFVYYDHCRGNGIDDGTHRYALTKGSCRPLFAEPPIHMYSGSSHVYRVCAS